MNAARLLWLVVDRWRIVLPVAVIGIGLGLAHYFITPVEYTSRVSMYVAAQVTDNPELAYQGAQLSDQRVKSYTVLVTSPGVIESARQQLGLPDTDANIANRIVASNATDTVIINIDATDRTPAGAANLANGIGTAFQSLVTRLELPASTTGIPAVTVRAIQPADIPLQPSSMSLPVSIVFGLLLGLLIGVALALVRGLYDNRVKSPDQLQDAIDSPVLGSTAYDPSTTERPAYDLNEPRSQSESYRHIRTNITYVDVDHPPKVIVVTSSLPGEGKSTIASNLAVALTASGHRVLLVDADLRRPRLAKSFGLEQQVGLTSVLTGRIDLDRAVQVWAPANLKLLTSGWIPSNPSELLGSQKMVMAIAEMRTKFDYVIIDTPPLLPVADAAVISGATDGVVLVCQHNKTSVPQVKQTAQALRGVGARILGSVLSIVPATGRQAYARYTTYYSSNRGESEPGSPEHRAASIALRSNSSHGQPASNARTGGSVRSGQDSAWFSGS